MGVANWNARPWLLAIAALCLAGVAVALTGQYVFDMRPCPWCILQRVTFIVIALVCLIGAAVPAPGAWRAAAGLSLVLALLGVAQALYHHFVAAKSASCNLTLADKIITALGLESLVPSLFQVTGSCAEAATSMLGIPFEIWSLALFFAAGALALRALIRG
ncbi:MAG TPA: disulfide bond formation protein B [Albitalea sp.]|nr:disulfide bond formation protein B [Albitalea sp.]